LGQAVVGHGPHDHGPHGQGPHGRHPDLNLRSAYLHVLADAATSALAIVALVAGLWLGWRALDPLIGLVGAVLVARWGAGLVRDTGRVLLDREMDDPLVAAVRQGLDEQAPWSERVQVLRLRLWRIGRNRWAGTLLLASHDPGVGADRVRRHLATRWPQLGDDITIEVRMR
jgi:Co/Zn/Cd efflux system component